MPAVTTPTYQIYEDASGSCIVCKRCKLHSRRPFDIKHGYCGNCLAFHNDAGPLLVRNVWAENGYRAAWVQWCLATNVNARASAEKCMNELQSAIGRSPKDPRYFWFVRSVPGLLGFWEAMERKYRPTDSTGGSV